MIEHDRMSSEIPPQPMEAGMLENEQEILKALVPSLVQRLREAVRHRRAYELAFESILGHAEADAHLSKSAGLALRTEVEAAYREMVQAEASKQRGSRASVGKSSGKIPRGSTREEREDIFYGKDKAAGAETEARHDEQVGL